MSVPGKHLCKYKVSRVRVTKTEQSGVTWTKIETWRKRSCSLTTVTLPAISVLDPHLFMTDEDIFSSEINRSVVSTFVKNST